MIAHDIKIHPAYSRSIATYHRMLHHVVFLTFSAAALKCMWSQCFGLRFRHRIPPMQRPMRFIEGGNDGTGTEAKQKKHYERNEPMMMDECQHNAFFVIMYYVCLV